jgi:pimeloyl-ACP methyl ester carboxylesterase
MANPTIVLVHGAFADASSWGRLYAELAADEYTIMAPANPLRGVGVEDAAYTRNVVEHRPAPLPDGGAEFTIDPSGFHETFCADLPAAEAAFMAISQRPLSGVAWGEKAPAPAWRTRPSWAVLPTADGVIHPDIHRFSFDRMGAKTTVAEGASHVVMLSRPAVVADVVREAAASTATNDRSIR